MNLNEVKKHVYFNLFLYIVIGICLLLSIIGILATPVKAVEQTADITNSIKLDTTVCSSGGSTGGRYCADDIQRSVGVTYNGRVKCIGFAFDYYFMNNRDYTLNIIANTNDFRNNNLTFYGYSYTTYPSNATSVNVQGRFIDKKKIQVVFPYDAQQTHSVLVCSSSNSYLTGDTNYNIKQVYLTYDDGQQDLTGIIDNATSNTTDIINNNNSNTTSMLERLEDNALQEANNQRQQLSNMCKNIYFTPIGFGKTINSGGNLQDLYGAYYTTDYIDINLINDSSLGNANYLYIKEPSSSTAGYYFAFYDNNKNFISLERTATRRLTIPSNAVWFRFGSTSPNTIVSRYSNNCIESSDKVYGYLNDDTDPNVNSSDIENVIDGVEINNPLSYLLNLPLHLITKINQIFSTGTCSRVDLGAFGFAPDYHFVLPCINFEEYLGSSLWNTIDVFVSIGLLAFTLYKIYHAVANILTLGGEDEVSYHLGYLTPMEFLASIIGEGGFGAVVGKGKL